MTQLILKQGTVRPCRLNDAESLARQANNRKIWLCVRDLFPHPYTLKNNVLKDGKLLDSLLYARTK